MMYFQSGLWEPEHLNKCTVYLGGSVKDLESRLESRHSVVQLEWKRPKPWHQAPAYADQPPATLNQFHSILLAEGEGLSELRNLPQLEHGLRNTPFEDILIGGGTARGSAGQSLSRTCFSARNSKHSALVIVCMM